MKTKRILLLLGNIFLLTALTACEQPIAQNLSTVNENEGCPTEGSYTSVEAKDFKIKLFNPNDMKQPDIWEGPICIINLKNDSACSADISLIKAAKTSQDEKFLLVNQFSGSNESIVKIAMNTCELSVE